MGTTQSKSRHRRRDNNDDDASMDVAARAQKVVGDIQAVLNEGDSIALLDTMCGGLVPGRTTGGKQRDVRSYYSEDAFSEDDSRTISEEETTVTDYRSSGRKRGGGDDTTVDDSYAAERRTKTDESSYEETDDDTERLTTVHTIPNLSKQPLASSFAKRCYFTKGGIGGNTQHYEGLTLNGNVVLLLAAAMKLKGCPTICDEDLRRVEQTYPNQFSRLPDELLLSSGWRRISKYCHFSNKPIPDGIPFFHSKERLKDSTGYYFLLAAAVGMVRPVDVEPLNRDTLVLLETDYPGQCDVAPRILIQDPQAWVLVDKFCFFSGGPINTEEDVYYEADFDGNSIFMLAFLSPCLTPTELYKLDSDEPMTEAAVHEVESVYDLTDRDFDDLKLYHLGPCRALPPFILQPQGWLKVLPPPFLTSRDTALSRAREASPQEQYYPSSYDDRQVQLEQEPFDQQKDYEEPFDQQHGEYPYDGQEPQQHEPYDQQYDPSYGDEPFDANYQRNEFAGGSSSRNAENYQRSSYDRNPRYTYSAQEPYPYYDAPDPSMGGGGIDPPEDEPPSLRKPEPDYYTEQRGSVEEPQENYYNRAEEPHDEYYGEPSPAGVQGHDQQYYDEPSPTDVEPHDQYYDEPAHIDAGEPHDEYYDEPSPVQVEHHDQYYDEPSPAGVDHHDQYFDEPSPVNVEHHDQYYDEPSPANVEHHDQYYDEPSPANVEHHDQYYDEPSPAGVDHHDQYHGDKLVEPQQEYYDEQPLDEPFDAPSIDAKNTSPMSETDFEPSPRLPRGPTSESSPTMAIAHEVLRNNRNLTPMSSGTMETDGSSEYSSVWTENEPDRTSRRALILQMARARMNKQTGATDEIDLTGELD